MRSHIGPSVEPPPCAKRNRVSDHRRRPNHPGSVVRARETAYPWTMPVGRDEKFPQMDEYPVWVPAVSCGIVVITLVAATFEHRPGTQRGPVVLAGLLAALPFAVDVVSVAVRRHAGFPLLAFPFPVLLGIGYLVWHPAALDWAPFVLVFMSAELFSRADSPRWLGITSLVACMALMVIAEFSGVFNGSVIWVIGIFFGGFGGYLVRVLDAKQQQLRAAQEGLSEKAAADERSRIAREVHDVIAHSLSVTMLHVTAARMALERGDRQDEAKDWLREAEEQGRKSLAEIRRTVGLLGPDESATAPPMPTLSDLPALISDFRNAGLDVTLSVEGDVEDLPGAAALNLYRIVQESLTNAAKHSPGAKTDVWLNVTDTDVRLRVFNEGGNGQGHKPNADGGRGIRGMTERSVLLNGNLMVGAENNGWLVFLAAPRPSQ